MQVRYHVGATSVKRIASFDFNDRTIDDRTMGRRASGILDRTIDGRTKKGIVQ